MFRTAQDFINDINNREVVAKRFENFLEYINKKYSQDGETVWEYLGTPEQFEIIEHLVEEAGFYVEYDRDIDHNGDEIISIIVHLPKN